MVVWNGEKVLIFKEDVLEIYWFVEEILCKIEN